MINKLFATGLLLLGVASAAHCQRIVVDSSSTKKYLISPSSTNAKSEKETSVTENEEVSFGDRAISIGVGIVNRLKARLNLEEAADSFKEKKEKILGREEESKGDG